MLFFSQCIRLWRIKDHNSKWQGSKDDYQQFRLWSHITIHITHQTMQTLITHHTPLLSLSLYSAIHFLSTERGSNIRTVKLPFNIPCFDDLLWRRNIFVNNSWYLACTGISSFIQWIKYRPFNIFHHSRDLPPPMTCYEDVTFSLKNHGIWHAW